MSDLVQSIIISDVPPAADVTLQNNYPFEITLFDTTCAVRVINLYSQFSRSSPYQDPQSKWGHLLPQWRFLDIDGNVTQSVTAIATTSVYNSAGVYWGLSGSVSFYYIDDLSTLLNQPVLIWATLETSGFDVNIDTRCSPGYANSRITSVVAYNINTFPPENLEITRNGIYDIPSPKWEGVEFPYVIEIQGGLNEICPNKGMATLFDYPSSNLLGQQYPINRNILGVATSDQEWAPATSYFRRYDKDNFDAGGFVKESVTSYASSLNIMITAGLNIRYNAPRRDAGYVWISNPENKTINRVGYFDIPTWMATALPVPPLTSSFYMYPVPLRTDIEQDTIWPASFGEDITGYGGIFGIAVDPCSNVWTVDSEQDLFIKFDHHGNVLSSIELSPSGCSPISISLDSNLNAWITLYGANSTIKIDRAGNLLDIVALPMTVVEDFDAIDHDLIKVRPLQVAADRDDNIWVTYEHYLSSLLVKYDTNGTVITCVNLPLCSQPQGIITDGLDGSLWISHTYEIILDPYTWSYPQSAGMIQKYSSVGTLLSTVTGFAHPCYITEDWNQNIWFTYGYCNVGCISGDTLVKFVASGGKFTSNITELNEADVINSLDVGTNEQLQGIACDGSNRIWIINSYESLAYVVEGETPTDYFTFTIYPIDYPYLKSAQAIGDWTGYNWYQRYTQSYNPNIAITAYISGVSNEFDIKPFTNAYEVRRFNESWDATTQIRNYALPEHIYNMYNLWINYMGNMVGGLANEEESLGRETYERTANFGHNHDDIDTCNITQLYSLAQETDSPIDDYDLGYPPLLRRLMDIYSVPHYKLWGDRCKCDKNFTTSTYCKNCNHDHIINLGDKFAHLTYTASAGIPFIVNYRYAAANHQLIETTTTAPLSTFASIMWLTSANYIDYDFYHHVSTPCGEQTEGIVNWDDSYTTLSEYNSSLSAWYDESGIIEETLNYMLHKGLQMHKD